MLEQQREYPNGPITLQMLKPSVRRFYLVELYTDI